MTLRISDLPPPLAPVLPKRQSRYLPEVGMVFRNRRTRQDWRVVGRDKVKLRAEFQKVAVTSPSLRFLSAGDLSLAPTAPVKYKTWQPVRYITGVQLARNWVLV